MWKEQGVGKKTEGPFTYLQDIQTLTYLVLHQLHTAQTSAHEQHIAKSASSYTCSKTTFS